ncbi:unnamed protein product [Mytilus edulis]|uniref:EF-hand domain-containing protein n=1 Tax=Mytilus edulis TaxID=6550 RepID=A0A8S3QLW7_MYTED|nr:unnamed protein product [Mytilus edulis]
MAYYNQGGQYQAGYQQGQPPQHGQYYQQQYQHYQQPSQQYGDYGNYFQQSVFSTNAWQAFQFQTPNELQQVFQMELQKNPANGKFFRCHEGYIHWSRELCSIMLSMLDRSGDGFMQWNEFQELQQCLVQWYQMFKQFDHDGSGYIEANELVNIVRTQFKYNLTPQSIETLLKRYSRYLYDLGLIQMPSESEISYKMVEILELVHLHMMTLLDASCVCKRNISVAKIDTTDSNKDSTCFELNHMNYSFVYIIQSNTSIHDYYITSVL